ncbi:MAG: hypothetical protein V3V08_10345 [Nannocystaceae bacterium]
MSHRVVALAKLWGVNERLGKILKVTEANPQLRTERLRQWNVEFDKDDATIDHIEAYIQDTRRFHEGGDLEVLLENSAVESSRA